MKRPIAMAAAVGALAVFFVTLSTEAGAQPIRRISSEFNYFESGEASTEATPSPKGKGGALIYKKTVLVPFKTVFVTMTATGDGHGGMAHLFSCVVDGDDVCNDAPSPTGVQSGWVNLQRHAVDEDFHDNSISYSWCASVIPNKKHTIELRLASSEGLDTVFIEEAYFYIDSADVNCTRLDPTI